MAERDGTIRLHGESLSFVGWFGLATVAELMRSQTTRNVQDAAKIQARLLDDAIH